MARKKKRHSTKALPWRTEVINMLETYRTYQTRIQAIDKQITRLQEIQGFDLESRAALLEITHREREKEELAEIRDMVQQAVNTLPEELKQIIELRYLQNMNISEISLQLFYTERAIHYRTTKALDVLAQYFNLMPVNTDNKPPGRAREGDNTLTGT